MSRDQIVAISDHVPRRVTVPTVCGALRPSDSVQTWQEEAREGLEQSNRIVLSGTLENFENIVRDVRSLIDSFPDARFAILIHWTQAAEFRPRTEDLCLFNAAYVAVDEAIESPYVQTIVRNWCPHWIFIPRAHVNWDPWIPETLLSERRGSIYLLTPPSDFTDDDLNFLNLDELRLRLAEFSLIHPLIEFRSPPPEWFLPMELGPWDFQNRRLSRTRVVHENRKRTDYDLSIVVPFRWTGKSHERAQIRECLKSIVETFSSHESCEIIVSVDRDSATPSFTASEVGIDLVDTAFVETVRHENARDWRAGFIRNRGANHARGRAGFLVFIDSDVVVQHSDLLRMTVTSGNFDLLMLLPPARTAGFETATSAFVVIRRDLFQNIGGFAEAFHEYGCEDNFLVWQAQNQNQKQNQKQYQLRVAALDSDIIRHIRARTDHDDLAMKMSRLRPSADLMYRMTLDENVHAHFFVSLGSDLWLRAGLKRLANHALGRILLAPAVFITTLIEGRSRLEYLRGFYDVAFWKLKRPMMWLRGNVPWRAAVFIRRRLAELRDPIQRNLWFFKEPTAWFEKKTPRFYRWVWRPLLKCRYFLEYHLLTRWRSS